MAENKNGSALGWLISEATIPGPGKLRNEDSYRVIRPRDASAPILALVADGASEPGNGDGASRSAVEGFSRTFDAKPPQSAEECAEVLRKCLEQAARAVQDEAALTKNSLLATTLTAIVLWPSRGTVWLLHIGDSRAYQCHDSEVSLWSVDHTIAHEREARGDYVETDDDDALARCLSGEGQLGDAFESSQILDPRSTYVICSDGITKGLSNTEICKIALEAPSEDPASVLVRLASGRQVRDDITAIVIRGPAGRLVSADTPKASQALLAAGTSERDHTEVADANASEELRDDTAEGSLDLDPAVALRAVSGGWHAKLKGPSSRVLVGVTALAALTSAAYLIGRYVGRSEGMRMMSQAENVAIPAACPPAPVCPPCDKAIESKISVPPSEDRARPRGDDKDIPQKEVDDQQGGAPQGARSPKTPGGKRHTQDNNTMKKENTDESGHTDQKIRTSPQEVKEGENSTNKEVGGCEASAGKVARESQLRCEKNLTENLIPTACAQSDAACQTDVRSRGMKFCDNNRKEVYEGTYKRCSEDLGGGSH